LRTSSLILAGLTTRLILLSLLFAPLGVVCLLSTWVLIVSFIRHEILLQVYSDIAQDAPHETLSAYDACAHRRPQTTSDEGVGLRRKWP
jgi:hypothetical protein